jgi:hypothetical protein
MLDVITDLAFDHPFALITKDTDVHEWLATIKKMVLPRNFISVLPRLQVLLHLKFVRNLPMSSDQSSKGADKVKG